MKTIKGVFAAIFVLGAVVQFNDPDPFLWIATYAIAAIVCVYSIFRPTSIAASLAVAILTLGWAIYLSPAVIGSIPFGDMLGTWEMKDTNVEKSREMYGLLFISFILFVISWHGRKTAIAERRDS